MMIKMKEGATDQLCICDQSNVLEHSRSIVKSILFVLEQSIVKTTYTNTHSVYRPYPHAYTYTFYHGTTLFNVNGDGVKWQITD